MFVGTRHTNYDNKELSKTKRKNNSVIITMLMAFLCIFSYIVRKLYFRYTIL